MEYVAAFVLRCSLACAVAYELTAWSGMSKPVWAAISALVVSQERLADTRSSLNARIVGTAAGAAISLVIGALGARVGALLGAELVVSVAIAAFVAHRHPAIRVAMWTCPVVLLTAEPSESLAATALQRACEVLFGASVGWGFHWVAEKLILKRPASQPGP
jgi:uncharacterized membrane protein YccC